MEVIMNIPEGWKRLEERVKQGYENHSADPDLAKMVYLCKEMAEALELAQARAVMNSRHPFEEVLSALKKFEEWK
jgi:hypothetical protein